MVRIKLFNTLHVLLKTAAGKLIDFFICVWYIISLEKVELQSDEISYRVCRPQDNEAGFIVFFNNYLLQTLASIHNSFILKATRTDPTVLIENSTFNSQVD